AGVWVRPESTGRVAELLGAPRREIEELAAKSDLLLIAVSDRAIAGVAGQIPQGPAIIFHASGVLQAVRGGFSLHPLKVLPPAGEPSDLEGALLVFEGNHRPVAESVAAAVGARFAEVTPEGKALYHAGAVFGANYVAALLEIASELLARAGIEDAREELAALAESAVRNWSAHTDARRFTGPAARGDGEVLERHLAALAGDPQVTEIYRLLVDRIRRGILATGE
ncbi:MAG: hypothetical protein JWN02_1459, partial [Acidobacteria bacterium]|nr:hypothetical protein [Acidobacteriota bacterium]